MARQLLLWQQRTVRRLLLLLWQQRTTEGMRTVQSFGEPNGNGLEGTGWRVMPMPCSSTSS